MQTLTDNATPSLIDYRELREQLPNAQDDALATEFNTGRISALVEDASGGGYDERRLPMAYDEAKDAWIIDRAEARQRRFLFRQREVDELASRHPEWRPQTVVPEPYYAPELQPLAQTLPIVLELEQERSRLAEALAEAGARLAQLKAEADRARTLEAEAAGLRRYQAWSKEAINSMEEAMDKQKALLDWQEGYIAELEAELAKAKASACIGEGLPRMACDFLRAGNDRDVAAFKLHECIYKPSLSVCFSLTADSAALNATLDPKADEQTINKRRGSNGQKAVARGAKKLRNASDCQPVDNGEPDSGAEVD